MIGYIDDQNFAFLVLTFSQVFVSKHSVCVFDAYARVRGTSSSGHLDDT